MTFKKNQNRMYSTIAQFCYEHKKMDSRFCKIRKNAKELAKMLDAPSSERRKITDHKFFEKNIKFFLTFLSRFHIIILALRKQHNVNFINMRF